MTLSQEHSAPVTAQVQYTGKSGNVIFVIKTGQVYGSIGEVREDFKIKYVA